MDSLTRLWRRKNANLLKIKQTTFLKKKDPVDLVWLLTCTIQDDQLNYCGLICSLLNKAYLGKRGRNSNMNPEFQPPREGHHYCM